MYVELHVGSITFIRTVGINLTAINKLFGDRGVNAQIDEDHQLERVFNVIVLSDESGTSSEIVKFLIMR